jgi:uncharacterized DUF497 family protein
MKLTADSETAAWLERMIGGEADFDWDAGNLTKNRKHGVESMSIEAIFANVFVFEGRIVEPTHPEARWLILGQDDTGRRLALIVARRGNRLRPISCRPMRTKERRRYEEAIESA